MRYHHVLFDIDGTLIDTEEMLITVFSRVLRQYYDHELTVEEFHSTFGLPCDIALENLGLKPCAEVTEMIQQGICREIKLAHVFPGVEHLVNTLHDAGLMLGLITSKNRREFESSFVPFGLANLFSLAICAGDTLRGKPHPDPILHYLSMRGAKPKETVYIGDAVFDRLCAEAAGVDFVLATWGYTDPAAREGVLVASTPTELEQLLLQE